MGNYEPKMANGFFRHKVTGEIVLDFRKNPGSNSNSKGNGNPRENDAPQDGNHIYEPEIRQEANFKKTFQNENQSDQNEIQNGNVTDSLDFDVTDDLYFDLHGPGFLSENEDEYNQYIEDLLNSFEKMDFE